MNGLMQPDIIGSYQRGYGNALMGGMQMQQAQAQRQDMERQQQFQNVLAEHGAGLMSGDPAALQAIAPYDPEMAFNMARQKQADARADRLFEMQIAEQARSLSAQEAAREAEQMRMAAQMGMAAQSPEQWDQIARENGAPELVGQFGQRDAIINRFLTAEQVLRRQAAPEGTSAQKNYEYLIQQGIPEKEARQRAFSGGGVTVNMGAEGPDYGKPPSGYAWLYDDAGKVLTEPDPSGRGYRPVMVPAAGSEAEQEMQAGQGKQAAAAESAAASSVNVLEKIEDVRQEVAGNPFASGLLGSIGRNVPGTGAFDADVTAGTIKANLGFDRLTQMRAESPTGGALGSVSQMELDRLESTIASLDLRQSKEQILENLNDIERQYTRILQNAYRTGDPSRLNALFGGRPDFIEPQGRETVGSSNRTDQRKKPKTVEIGGQSYTIEEID